MSGPDRKSVPVRKMYGGTDFLSVKSSVRSVGTDFLSVNRGPVRWYGFLVLIIRTGTDFKIGTVRGTEFSTEN